MIERDMEDLISQFPDQFSCFRERGLRLIGRQQRLGDSERSDLLFEDHYRRSIVMELKARRLRIEDADQIVRYKEALERDDETRNWLMFVVAPEIARSIRDTLERNDIWWFEIREPEFRGVANQQNRPWPPERPRPEPSAVPTTSPRLGSGGRGPLVFTAEKPDPDRFQWVLVPLIRREFSINELINLFLSGPLDRSGDRVIADLFGNGIVDRNTDRTRIRAWIIARLKGRGLDPTCSLYGVFKFISYSGEGSFQNLTIGNIDGLRDDVPIRIICCHEWFRRYGRNSACRRYFGGDAENQGVFYGEYGRFPLRPGIDISRDCP